MANFAFSFGALRVGVAFPALLDGISHESVYTPATDEYAEEELLAWKRLDLKPGGRQFWLGTEAHVGKAPNVEQARSAYEQNRANGFSLYVADESDRQQTVFYPNF